MKLLSVPMAALLLHGAVQAQCDRLAAFDSVRTYYEANHPGLNTWRGTPDWAPYQQAADALRAEVEHSRSPEDLGVYVQEYVHLLKDHHSWASAPIPQQPDVKDTDSASVQAFLRSAAYLNTERIALDTATLLPRLRALPVDSVDGIYKDLSGTYRFAMIPSPDPAYDHYGVILSSTNRNWSPGMVKMKLKHLDSDRYVITLWMRFHVQMRYILNIRRGFITDLNYRKENKPLPEQYSFKAIDNSTNYMQVASFDGSLYAELDSFYRAHDAEVMAKRNLILDLRGNGGGSEGCWERLIGYFYSDSIRLVQADLLAAPGNIACYVRDAAAVRADSTRQDPEWAVVLEQQVAKMRAVPPGSFVPWSDGPANWISFGKAPVPTGPVHVYILQDGACASATESFIYYATRNNNPRVTSIGTNSGGYMAYGNVEETTVCGFSIGCTTTRYNAFCKYEFVGLPPQVPIGPGEDALQTALRIIRERR